jgi:hypothetical protein
VFRKLPAVIGKSGVQLLHLRHVRLTLRRLLRHHHRL